MTRPCSVLRVFTRGSAGGNHLGVVTDVAGLSAATMQQIAAELGFSETVFIIPRQNQVPFARIFTTQMEMPFAGHPLVGAASMLLEQSNVDRLACGIGEVLIRQEGDVVWVDAPMYQRNARIDPSGFASRVGLPEPVSTWRVEMPLDYRIVELPVAEAVSKVAPDTTAFGDAHGLAVYARQGDQVRMRFFIPEAGIEEDPATGSAAVALATRLAADGEPFGALTIDQGEEIGHPSRIQLQWSGETASIGGTVATDQPLELSY
ncbi:MAG: PhzF family phenazine biosynthesis protein [Acidimicrobiia bacterium]|nr:PhzF family phenazine biosynthesis protein [Acidimicrobiia bacterium]MDX2466454.1 PhzF family phenazine biosynthesis protein [Acidimicrobiia bacterium]